MIRSMTGYGRAQEVFSDMSITLEIKSVNHRYFEFSSRTPRNYGFLEEKLKSFMQNKIYRGKIETFVQIETLDEPDVVITVNKSLASAYINAFTEISDSFSITNDITTTALGRYNDIFLVRKEAADENIITERVLAVAGAALNNFIEMRETEGTRLKADVIFRMDAILKDIEFVEERSPETVKEYNLKLITRMRELLEEKAIDEQRLLTEAAVFADKIAVAEETVRLRSHIDQLKKLFDSDGAVGRKMDFIVQEINREANTIGSKAQDIDIARRVVNIKSEIEKIREQVQNIE